MKPDQYNKELRTIHSGLQAAARVIEARTLQLKAEAPGLPIDAIRMEVRAGHPNDCIVAQNIIAEWERLAVQERASA